MPDLLTKTPTRTVDCTHLTEDDAVAVAPTAGIPKDGVAVAGHAEDALGALLERVGVAEEPVDIVTPALFGRNLLKAAGGALRHPVALAGVTAKLAAGTLNATTAAMSRAVGGDANGPVAPARLDRRFDDPAWRENPLYFLLQQLYLLQRAYVDDVVTVADLSAKDEGKARLAVGLLGDALAPTNTLLGNPAALRRAYETGGQSLVRGGRNFVRDFRQNGGWPAQVDASGFEVGRNMATTPGKVVYRSDLIELIQYAPQTPKVFAVPLLFCPPWINKYYVMDLAPGRSLIEWAVAHGHTCFAISYRNPSEGMTARTFDDYLLGGPIDAIRVVRTITESPVVNTMSVCLGGTLSAMAMAYDAARGDASVNSATFINAHTDFTEPGVLGAFTDEGTIRGIERRMAKKGYLEAKQMSRTFDAIRANDLIFQYVVKNWLLGEQPPAFDLLAWNDDSTRMPAEMHSRYLRSCYLRNEFAQGEFTVDGTRLDPSAVSQPTYVIGAIDDHIVPWRSAYRTTQLLGGRNRFVLSGSGHIAGIVAPPSPKARHWSSSSTPPDPAAWQERAELHPETWWEDWARWISRRAGRKVAARPHLGGNGHEALCDAPGSYVFSR
jgi:polyhydroxyalkanoate synthase